MRSHKDKGNVLLYLIVIVSMLTALGTGVFYLTSTSTFSGLGNAQNKARYLAESGIRYALANWKSLHNMTSPLEYKNAAGDKFILDISSGCGDCSNCIINSNGVSNPGTPYEASNKIAFYVPLTQCQELAASSPFSFSGAGSTGIASLTTFTGTSGVGTPGLTGVSVDTVNKQLNLGSGGFGTTGCVWYQGLANSNGSECINGKCNFNKGIRAYFDFQYNTPWQGEGFTFAIVSGHNIGTDIAPVYINDYTDCGGGLSEYMAYAGPGVSPPGKGLQPPKIAVEFDPFLDVDPVSGLDNPNWCAPYSRNDLTFASTKHSTFVYWGDNLNYCAPSSNTYDDNRHGNGNGTTDPKNPDGTDINSYMIQDFDSFGTGIASPVGRKLSFRLEIDRVDDTTSADYRKYKMRVWLKPYVVYLDSNGVTYAVYKDSNKVTFDDTSKKFNQNNDYPPDFQQTITLTQTWHDNFDRILFGWTQATDSTNTQTVIISNFRIDFKNQNDF